MARSWNASKYGNKKYYVDAIEFDSIKEAHRYEELKMMQKAGIIRDLKLQVKYELIPYQKRFKERAVVYIADFTYTENGKTIVEDVKGYKTRDYIIKRKLFRWRYCQSGNIIFREV